MQNKNVITILVGLVAVVVVIESIVLIGNLGKNGGLPSLVNNVKPEVTVAPTEAAVFETVFSADSGAMKVGKSYKVGVDAVAKESKMLDAVSLFVKYDPQAMTISGLASDAKLPKPFMAKVSEKSGLVVVSYLVTGTSGLKISAGDVLSLAKFNVTPKKEGTFKLELSTSKDSKESATMFVESVTNKALPYSSNELNVNVTK